MQTKIAAIAILATASSAIQMDDRLYDITVVETECHTEINCNGIHEAMEIIDSNENGRLEGCDTYEINDENECYNFEMWLFFAAESENIGDFEDVVY